MNKADKHKQPSNPGIECNSPPCYAHEINWAYQELTSKPATADEPKEHTNRNQDDKTG